MSMTIYVNGKKEELENNMDISRFLEVRKIRPEVVTVELNDNIVERNKYSEIKLKVDDRVELVYYMGGGNQLVANSVLELIGNTPMVKLNRMVSGDSASIYGKLESFNPGGSVKDRPCLEMIVDAEERGLLKDGATISELVAAMKKKGLSSPRTFIHNCQKMGHLKIS